MSFYNKLKWILGITLIFVLIIATNLIDRNNFLRIRDAVTTIYEDRLIANDLIFQMLTSVHQKQLAFNTTDTLFFNKQNDKVNAVLQSYVMQFEKTKLTDEEAEVFADLKKNMDRLFSTEKQFLASNFSTLLQVNQQIDLVITNLNTLSAIQLNEGKKQMSISEGAVESVELFTQIEIYILIFLAVLVQLIVMYKPKIKL